MRWRGRGLLTPQFRAQSRRKAIETFVRFDHSYADTVAEPVCPDRGILRGWWQAYLEAGAAPDAEGHTVTRGDSLREFCFTGGRPEVVRGFVEGRPTEELRGIQKRILQDYSLDISKHAKPEILGRIHQVWNSIPRQLARSNKKFVYGDIQRGARAKDFEPAIEWLIDAGLVYKVPRVRKAGVPLKFYEDFSGFKLFLLDHGLMGARIG